MSKRTQEFFDQIKAGEQPGLASKLKEIGGKLWDALTPMVEHGAHEMATALLRGSDGYVMYQHKGKEGQSHEGQGLHGILHGEVAKEEPQQQEQSRGGREM
jgi:hypothetical protein